MRVLLFWFGAVMARTLVALLTYNWLISVEFTFLTVVYPREFLWNTLNKFTFVLLFNLLYKT